VLSKTAMGHKAKATLSAAGDVEVQGECVTIKASVYDEEEDAETLGTITLDGDVETTGNVTAESLTIGTGTCTNLDELATTPFVASLERRVEALERMDTCILWWTEENMKAGTTTNLYNVIPTNFPTQKLAILMVSSNNLHTVSLPTNFVPDRHLSVQIRTRIVSASTNYIRYGTEIVQSTSASRNYIFDWDPALSAWAVLESSAVNAPRDGLWPGGYGVPENAPATVEEWLALHPEWQ